MYELGLKVAALMTADMIARRLKDTFGADRIFVPGRCRGDLEALSKDLGIPVERGPEELKDLPQFFGQAAHKMDLSRYRVKIFAEITDAPNISVEEAVKRAYYYKQNGADVIDIGCLPSTDFPHMEAIIGTLKQEGFTVSIDSLENDDLLRGGKAGADYLLSLHENIPVDRRRSGFDADSDSGKTRRPGFAGPGHSGHAGQESRLYRRPDPGPYPLRVHGLHPCAITKSEKNHPDIEMMLGVGNLTELFMQTPQA